MSFHVCIALISVPNPQEQRNEHSHSSVDSTAAAAKKLMFWDTSKSNEHQKLEEELMTTRIREMETLTELKELRLKVMELETQVQVSTNQLRRQDDEAKRVRDELETALQREKDAASKAREQQHRYGATICNDSIGILNSIVLFAGTRTSNLA